MAKGKSLLLKLVGGAALVHAIGIDRNSTDKLVAGAGNLRKSRMLAC